MIDHMEGTRSRLMQHEQHQISITSSI